MDNYKTHSNWTQQELEVLKSAYALGGIKYAHAVLTKTFKGFDRSIDAVKSTAGRYGYKSAIDGCFKKGKAAANKGKKMSEEQYLKSAPTMFKKGIVPQNTKYDGHISVRVDNKGNPYKHIRVRKGKYVLLHRKIWEDVHGAIPAKHIVRFINGDTMDCRIENLECISMAENLRRNHKGHRFAKELTDNYVRGVLKRRGVDPSVMSDEMVQLKKAELILQRTIKEKKNGKR